MASGQTTFGGVEQPATGENLNVWGPLVNKMLQRSIEIGAGFKTVSLTGNQTLDTTIYDANDSRWNFINFTDGGLSSQPTVTFPAETRYWLINNSGSTYSVACKASGSAVAAVIVEASSWALIYSDGTDMFVRDLSSMSGDLPLSSLETLLSSRVVGNLSQSSSFKPTSVVVLNDDNMTGASATSLATSLSIKNYIDNIADSENLAAVAAIADEIAAVSTYINTLDGIATTVDISLTAGSSEQMDFTVTVKDAEGATVTGVHCLTLWYSDSSTGSSVVTTKAISVTTGEFVAAGLFGTNLLNGAGIVATDANGVFSGSVIDSGKPADHYIVVKKPLGSGVVISDASGSNWGA